jgi:hypothetical protein
MNVEMAIKRLESKEVVSRTEVQELLLKISEVKNHLLLRYSTRLGKALSVMKLIKHHKYEKILFVVMQSIHIENLIEDAKKHNIDISGYTIICWNSYKKYYGESWDCIVMDSICPFFFNSRKSLRV